MFVLLTMTALTLCAQEAPAGSRGLLLDGTVADEQGRPIVGAKVFISTAAPRRGVGLL